MLEIPVDIPACWKYQLASLQAENTSWQPCMLVRFAGPRWIKISTNESFSNVPGSRAQDIFFNRRNLKFSSCTNYIGKNREEWTIFCNEYEPGSTPFLESIYPFSGNTKSRKPGEFKRTEFTSRCLCECSVLRPRGINIYAERLLLFFSCQIVSPILIEASLWQNSRGDKNPVLD